MDTKKLQHLQQTQNVQKKLPLSYQQTNIADYRSATHSPKVFQQQQQHQQKQQSTGYYMANHNALTNAQYQQSPTTASSMSGPMSPIDMQPHSNKLLLNANMGVQSSNGNTSGSAHSSPYHQVSTSSAYPTSSGTLTEQLYQSPTERTYLAAAGRLHGSTGNPASTLQQQYQQLQQAKLQAQLQTQNEAIQHQQRNFALRQAMNPPVPQNHYHMSQTPSMMSGISQQQSTASQRAHPTTLNINNNTYLAGGGNASTINHQQQQQQHFHHNLQQQSQQQPLVQRRHPEPIYGQHQHQQIQMQLHNQQQLHHQQSHYHPLQQRSKSDLQTPIANSDQSPVYIQQNHPGHVMNQACQTQISAVAKTNQITKTPSSEESSSASVKSPSHAPLDRKKSSGGSASSNTQALKSPLTKRPPSSPVTMSDWLYKQGSDGLKVWRKRWFVLAEYCLYYYKGPEEEKLLGSILLPSYKVSACLPEDKIYRKYAFKCEHQNMRTYWLAAENADSMIQWVRALSAATMMQAPSSSGADSSEQPSAASSSNQSGENSDSGIHTLQSQQSKLSSQGHVTPASDNSGNATGTVVNSNNGVASSGSQPLYANAPPKPRRITDGGYSSPSPENSVDNERRIAHHTIKNHQLLQQHQQQIQSSTLQQLQQHQQQQQQQQQYIHAHNNQNRSQHHAIYDTRTGNVSSTLRIPQHQQQQQQQPPPPQHHMSIQSPSSAFAIDALDMQYKQQMSMLNEEYSQNSPNGYMDAQMEAQIMQLQQQRAAIGDDTYGEHDFYMQEAMQQRYPKIHANNYKTNNMDRRTPDAYGRSNNRIFSDYEDIYNLTQGGMMGSNTVPMSAQEALLQEAASYRRPLSPTIYDRNKHIPTMPAHFTTNHIESTLGQHLTGSSGNMRAKPVSSIMRPHSADFLEYESRPEITSDTIMPSNFVNQTNKSDPVRTPRPKSSLDINRTPDSFYYSEENYAEKMRKSALYLQNPQSHVQNLAQPQQASPYKTLSSSNDYLNSNSGMHTIGYENPYERAHKRNELLHDALANTTGHTSIPRLNRGQMLGAGSHVRSHSIHPHIKSPDQQSGLTGLTTQQIIQQNEQFLRSASARLPKRANSFDDGPQSPTSNVNNVEVTIAPTTSAPNQNTNVHNTHLEGERKREESMKRLLEWKQRMLQSPLTRKSTHSQRATSIAKNNLLNNHKSKHSMSAVSQLGSNPNLLVSSHSMATGGTHYSSKRTSNISSNITLQRSRSESHANTGPSTGYNSYSSDDEASISIRNVRNLPKGNLTVKLNTGADTTQQQQFNHHEHQQKQEQERHNNCDQTQKLTNNYYGTVHDTKYAKTTLLSERKAKNDGNDVTKIAAASIGTGVGAGSCDRFGVATTATATAIPITLNTNNNNNINNNNSNGKYATSTPLHPDASDMNVEDYFPNSNNTTQNAYGLHSTYHQTSVQQQQQEQQYQHQQRHQYPLLRRYGSRAEIDILERETSTQIRNLDVSAGDLLSRTHEELILLLIQLRRQGSNIARNIEKCCSDIHDVQNHLRIAEGLSRAESIQRLDYLKQHLLDLERQYEKSKPLVNLVDNMVKLGSLYRHDATQRYQQNSQNEASRLENLEFNQRMQERRLLQEEQKQWDRINPNHNELQSKVHQLYQLDQLLQEESGTLQNLQRDKEDLERALGGLRARIQDNNGSSLALEAAKKQQNMLERELSRVHQLLADNSKKLEQTVAGNARLEQELLILRQKLQTTRSSQNALAISDTYASNTTAMLESELKRVQTLVGDMQRQRQELSSAVKQLTENSNRLYQEIGQKAHSNGDVDSVGDNNNFNTAGMIEDNLKKRTTSGCWFETDLDSMISVNRIIKDSTMNLSTPLYVDTLCSNNSNVSQLNNYDILNELDDKIKNHKTQKTHQSTTFNYNDLSDNMETSGVDSDGFLETNPFLNLTTQEKQEIKTVRIVKRESERRHRDRSERSCLSNSTHNLDQVLEEDQYGHMHAGDIVSVSGNQLNTYIEDYRYNGAGERSKSLPRTYGEPVKVTRHHHRHKHSNSAYYDYTNDQQYMQNYERNNNYRNQQPLNKQASIVVVSESTFQSQQQQQQPSIPTNGHMPKEITRGHLNPLANAYFAKQMHEKQKQQQQSHQAMHLHNNSCNRSSHLQNNLLRHKTASIQSLNKSLSDLTPDFQSEAAKQILSEMSAGSASEDTEKIVDKVPAQYKHRRIIPREKRRHYTAPNNVVNVKDFDSAQTENDMNRNNTNWRARDDLDMEVALRPRHNAPDVVRSAMGRGEKISENTIDNLLLAPNKIVIPERYIPEITPELSPEEKKRRQEKVESIKKMLAETPISTTNETTASLPSSKLNEEKKQREHLLQLNQILAQQVMQMSKIVAGNPPPSQTNTKPQ